jgi:hypothetical protein
MASPQSDDRYDVFLSHSHLDAEWVEQLAAELEDTHQLTPWLDRWVLVPGKPWQPDMARGLEQATSCAVFLGARTPSGWFEREIEKALNRQTTDETFRVIPVLLPGALQTVAEKLQGSFLELNTWVDFGSSNSDQAFHLLVCGVKGTPPGRFVPSTAGDVVRQETVDKLSKLRDLRAASLIDDAIATEKQGKILDKYLGL